MEEEKNMEKGENKLPTPNTSTSKMRQILIETDGNRVSLVKAEVAGNMELKGILTTLLNNLA